MTLLALGRHWPRATAKQKQALVTEFRNLLVRTYSSSLTSYNNQTIDYKPLTLKPGDTDVTVKSVVHQPGGQPIPIDYSLDKTDNGWKVYDVTIDGVSLVTNYRASLPAPFVRAGSTG